jgi:two-component system, NarL family, nitrate/nitrite response regulator NarL
MTSKRVLLVDDNASVRFATTRLFEASPDFEVCGAAADGREAIEKARSLNPDLIVLDLSMPVMNGLEAAAILLQAVPDVRMILFTAHNGPEVSRLSRAAGIHAIVTKSQSTQLIERARALFT